MKLGILGYVPPPKVGNPALFLANLEKNPPSGLSQVLLYSDHPWPGVIPLHGSPEMARQHAPKNVWAVNNMVFWTGVRIAQVHGLTHFIYLESDCRVGRPAWDEVMWDEFFAVPRPLAMGGTLACYNPCNAGLASAKRWEALVARNVRKNFPVATYGWVSAKDKHPSNVFCNGALGVYSMAWIKELFKGELELTSKLASETFAWDMMLGQRLWSVMGKESYDVVAHLDCIYSGFGEAMTTESERVLMLRDGKVVAIHQVKSSVVL